jgi:hypothetical protein
VMFLKHDDNLKPAHFDVELKTQHFREFRRKIVKLIDFHAKFPPDFKSSGRKTVYLHV